MLVSRDAMRAFGLILLLALSMVGCQSVPEQIASKVETDEPQKHAPSEAAAS